MNSLAEILTYAEQHHIQIAAHDGKLTVKALDGVLTPDFLEKARQCKPDLIVIVRVREACLGQAITPDQFLLLTTLEDRGFIRQGAFPPETLRAYAGSFAEGIRDKRIVFHPTTGQLVHHN